MKDTPVVTDEAVEKLARTYYENLGWDWDDLDTDLKDHDENKATILREFRAALEAAAPLLGTRPQPTLDAGALSELATWYRAQAEGCEQLRAANEESGADLTAVDYAARASTWASAAHYLESLISDGAVRPLPTREQIDKLLEEHGVFEVLCESTERVEARHRVLTAAIVALFTGGKE